MPKRLHAQIKHAGPLTPRETAVLKLLCEGYMRKEIARKVLRSYGCISKQVESIAQKLEVHSTTEIVATAVARGMVEINVIQRATQQLLKGFLIFITLGQLIYPVGRRPHNPPRPSLRLVRRAIQA